MQKTRLADPFFLFDQLGVHDRDLSGRPAEADEAELEPETQGGDESWMAKGWGVFGIQEI